MTGSVSLQHQHADAQLACLEPSAATPRSVVDAWLRKLRLHHHQYQSSADESPQCESSEPQQKRKHHPSFLKALFKPHELKAITNASPEATAANSSSSSSKRRHKLKHKSHSSNQSTNDQHKHKQQRANQSQRVVPPVEIPSMYTGRQASSSSHSSGSSGGSGSVTVGGRRVPFTRDAHRRLKKKSVKALACIAETHAVSSLGSMSMDAYRSRAYYPASSSSAAAAAKQRKEKR